MNHHLTISTEKFAELKTGKKHLLTKNTTTGYRKGDTLTVTQKDSRDQATCLIGGVETEHIHSSHVLLYLCDVDVVIDTEDVSFVKRMRDQIDVMADSHIPNDLKDVLNPTGEGEE